MILSGIAGFLALFSLTGVRAQTTVTVSATASHPIPTTLWGQMFEDISHSGDGGLYAELLQNRAFQQVTPGTTASLTAWQAVNGASISVVADPNPVSNALPNSLAVEIPSDASGQVGVANTGYFGIKIDSASTYAASFYYRFPTASDFSGDAVVSLQTSNGDVLGSASVALDGSQTTFTQVTTTITPDSSAADTDNLFVVAVNGPDAAGQTINFALFSLFPPTFKDRPNGMRVDIAEALQEMAPSFFRFPGGNNLEGQIIDQRWQWNNTVGPLTERPGRVGDWGYINTDGLGLLEYLQWCEDLDMEPIMAVWSGFALGGDSVAEEDLGPYIQQSIDQINFVIGDPADSDPAALRASLGHPDPFFLQHVEVGNEDFFASDTYTYRWTNFVNALQAEFPDLRFLATSNTFNPVLDPNPQEWDIHVYQTPSWFAENSFIYDGFERNGTIYFEGEYAAISTNPNDIFGTPEDGRLLFPTMQSSSGEAAFMIGLERNADIVFAASYAPLLNHVANSQWTPNLVSFDAGAVYRSTSYYVQQLFSVNRGEEYLPSTLPSASDTLFWSVVRVTSVSPNQIIIKVANTGDTTETLTFDLPFDVSTSGTVQLLTGGETDSNTPDDPNNVVPTTTDITTGQNFSYNAPAFSVSVLTLTAA